MNWGCNERVSGDLFCVFRLHVSFACFVCVNIPNPAPLDYICLALLLGSDYTTGVHGIGIVNATEIIRVFPGVTGLKAFKTWIDAADEDELLNGGKTKGSKQKRTQKELSLLSELEQFKYVHRKARRRWRLNEHFPSQAVVDAYLHPLVDSSTEKVNTQQVVRLPL